MRRIGIPVLILFVVFGLAFVASYGFSAQFHSDKVTEPDQFQYVLHGVGNKELVLKGEGRDLIVIEGKSEKALKVQAMNAKFGPDGAIYFINMNLGLEKVLPNGEIVRILPDATVNGPLLINASGSMLAYSKPSDFDGDIPLTNGIAILDLKTNQERILKTIPGETIKLLAWRGNQLVIELPPYGAERTLSILSLDGELSPGLTLKRPKGDSAYPVPSFDSKYLAAETDAGVAIVSLADLRIKKTISGSSPEWRLKGLKVNWRGKFELVSFEEVEK